MTNVLTLVGAPTLPCGLADSVYEVMVPLTLQVSEPDWLAPGIACDLTFKGADTATIETAIRAKLGDAPVDMAVQSAEGRRKRLLIADMDSTIIQGESLDDLAEIAGVGKRVAAITARAMNGEIDFKGALRERVGLLAGLSETALEKAYEEVRLMPGAEALVRTMRAHGAFTALVSGGFSFFTNRIRRRVGFDHDEANRLEIAEGHLTGLVHEPILNRDGKSAALVRLCDEHGLLITDSLAVGDGANDLSMIQRAGLGVAFHAKPSVRIAAPVRIDHANLTALLYLQGYHQAEIVTASDHAH